MTDNKLGKVDIQKLMENTDSPYVKAIWNAAIESAAACVDQTNRDGPYNAIVSAREIRKLKR